MKKKYGQVVMILICVVVCAVGVAIVLQKGRRQAATVGNNEEGGHLSILKQLVPSEIEIPIDFEELKKINKHIYAWIDIEDTNVHYPIAQHPHDDSYYLDYTIEGVKGLPGSIYTEQINSKDFTDFNTLIYGHDMRDGSMFKHLHKFSDEEFFNEHDTITIYTEDAILKYTVLAAVVYDNRHIMYAFDQSDMDEREEFLESLYQSKNWKNKYREGVEVDEESHLVTLSTCITGHPENRWIVVGVQQ